MLEVIKPNCVLTLESEKIVFFISYLKKFNSYINFTLFSRLSDTYSLMYLKFTSIIIVKPPISNTKRVSS